MESFRLQEQAERFQDIGLIVGDEDPRILGTVGWTCAFRSIAALIFEMVGNEHGL
jgi:hypothetical protein